MGRKIEQDEKIRSFLLHFAIDFIAAVTLPALYFAIKYPLCVAVGIGFWAVLIFFLNKYIHVAAKLSHVAYAGIKLADYIIR